MTTTTTIKITTFDGMEQKRRKLLAKFGTRAYEKPFQATITFMWNICAACGRDSGQASSAF
jgi:hypothetical protein